MGFKCMHFHAKINFQDMDCKCNENEKSSKRCKITIEESESDLIKNKAENEKIDFKCLQLKHTSSILNYPQNLYIRFVQKLYLEY